MIPPFLSLVVLFMAPRLSKGVGGIYYMVEEAE